MKWNEVVTQGSRRVGIDRRRLLVQCKGFVLVLGLCIGVVLAEFDGVSFGRLVLGGDIGSGWNPICEDGHGDGRGVARSAIGEAGSRSRQTED